MRPDSLKAEALHLLEQLIATPSLSGEEAQTADLVAAFLQTHGVVYTRKHHNLLARNLHYDPGLPSILLCSHHDTVRPNKDWTRDPFRPQWEEGKLYGLGSNDAGGALVALLATFCHFHAQAGLPFNLLLAAVGEEETSGPHGVSSVLEELGAVDFAIVGEPTEMQLAVAEKGLIVLQCTALGKSGHAARDTGVNAIAKAMESIQWFHSYRFERESPWLGPVKMTVTMIEAGSQHNVVPAECHFTVDIRTTDAYTHEEIVETIEQQAGCLVHPKSLRLHPSSIGLDTPLVLAGKEMGRHLFGSPTISDQALLPFPSLKMGPGRSERSHTADEFIYGKEVEEGIDLYIELLERSMKYLPQPQRRD